MNHTLDASGKAIGRIATEAVAALRGKDKPGFTPNAIPTTKVEIINASSVRITGNKLQGKIYKRHSGYPGGLKTESLQELIDKKGTAEAIRKAIYGMLPANRIRKVMMNNLTIKE